MNAKPIATLRSFAGVPTGRLAMWWLLASEIVIFGGLIVGYLIHRNGHPEWALEAAHTNTLAGAINTFVLLSSSLSAVLAHQAAQTGNGRRAANFLWLTILGAVTFLIIKSFEWTHEIQEGFVLTKSGFWSFYYCAAGLHAAHVIAGVARTLRRVDCAVMADQCVDLAAWFADLAHDLEQILDRQEPKP